MQGLCFAFITSKDISIKAKNAKLLANLSKGIPGLLTRFLTLVADPLYRTSLLQLAKKDIPAESVYQGRHQPSRYVRLVQQACWEIAVNTEDKPVLSLVSACQAHPYSIPLPLAASIAHSDHGIFSSSVTSSMVGFALISCALVLL